MSDRPPGKILRRRRRRSSPATRTPEPGSIVLLDVSMKRMGERGSGLLVTHHPIGQQAAAAVATADAIDPTAASASASWRRIRLCTDWRETHTGRHPQTKGPSAVVFGPVTARAAPAKVTVRDRARAEQGSRPPARPTDAAHRQHDDLGREPVAGERRTGRRWTADQLHASGSCPTGTSSVNATNPLQNRINGVQGGDCAAL